MMKFDILTLFPEVFSSVLNSSILKNASENGILEFNYINIRDFTNDKHKRVDDYPYGGGAGMLLQTQPIYDAYKYVLDNSKKRPKTIYLSPRGKVFNQEVAKELSKEEHIVLICGHYEGIDQRIIDEICDCELSIGDFVLTGGELAAMVVCDSVSRLVPGVLSGEESYSCESHYNGLLEFPQYTRPRVFHNVTVPEVLLSGNDKNIREWRQAKSYEITYKMRPELLTEQFELEKQISPIAKYCLCYMGDDIKTISAIEMQLKKNNIIPEKIYTNHIPECELITIVIYDNYKGAVDISDKGCFVKLNSITEFEAIDYEKFKHLKSCEITNIADFIKNYLIYNEIRENGEIPQKFGERNVVSISGTLPVELYENHRSKFDKVCYEDIFVVEGFKGLEPGEYTINNLNNALLVNLITIKSKRSDKKTVVFGQGIKQYILNNDSGNIEIVKGNWLKYINFNN